jgi:hypothetical protein
MGLRFLIAVAYLVIGALLGLTMGITRKFVLVRPGGALAS